MIAAALLALAATARCPGTCTRVETPHGALQLYWPHGFRRARAGLVIYVHGLGTTVDKSFEADRLAAQFAASGRHALFVVAGGREQKDDQPPWPDLGLLLRQIEDAAGALTPQGPLVVMGHSGAFSQIALWLPSPRVRSVVLLDGFYGREAEFAAWTRAPQHRLLLVNHGTTDAANAWAKQLRYARRRRELTDSMSDLPAEHRNARVLSVRTQMDHYAIVTDGRAIPWALAWTTLPQLRRSHALPPAP